MSDRVPLPSDGARHHAPRRPSLPGWLEPVRRGAADITVAELTRLVPPRGARTRRGAVLVLFGNADTRDTDKKTIEHGDGERCGLLYTGYRLTISFLVSLH